MAETLKLSERRHPLYEDNEALWEFYLNSAKGGINYINESNLFSHRLEDSEDYEERLKRAFYLNFCDIIPTVYNNFIFKSAIGRPIDEYLDEIFRNNVDGSGTDINDFVKKVGYLSSVFGAMHVLVATPATDFGIVLTKQQEKEQNIRPYTSLIYPQELVDWSIDKYGNFNWVILESTYLRDSDPNVEREEETHYKLITKEEWKIVDEDGNSVSFDDSESSGKNTLGFVPIVTIYHKNVNDNKVGESLLKDIVYLNRAIFNWGSCIDEQIERQTFSQLVIPDDGTLADRSEEGENPLNTIGTSTVWTFPSESKNPPAFISPNVENINAIWKLILDHAREIFRMSGLQGASDDLHTSRSGRAGQFSFLGVNSALAEKSKIYQKFENDIYDVVYKLAGKDPKDLDKVKYPSDFDVSAIEDEIDSFMKIMERNFSPKLNKVMQKSIARKATPLETDTVRKEIEDEIEASDGVVLPLSTVADPLKFDDGSGNPNSTNTAFKTKTDADEQNVGHRAVEK
jgi:hypothetical protein